MKQTYTTEKIESISEKLRNMPVIEKKKREHSKQESVKILAKEIVSLQKKGYTLDQVSEILRGEGLDISTPTLKSYLQRSKPGEKKPNSKAQKKEDGSEVIKNMDAITATKNERKGTFVPNSDSEDI